MKKLGKNMTKEKQKEQKREEQEAGFKWNSEKGFFRNSAGATLHHTPKAFEILGSLFGQVDGVFSGVKKYDKIKDELRTGQAITTEILEDMRARLSPLKNARVKAFDLDHFEIGFPSELDFRGRPITTGFLVGPEMIYNYSFPGANSLDKGYFDAQKDPKYNRVGGSAANANSLASGGQNNLGFLGTFKQILKTAAEITKDSASKVNDTSKFLVSDASLQSRVEERFEELFRNRRAKAQNLSSDARVERNGQFVLLDTPEIDYTRMGLSILPDRNLYLVDLANGLVAARYDAVDRRAQFSRPGYAGSGSP